MFEFYSRVIPFFMILVSSVSLILFSFIKLFKGSVYYKLFVFTCVDVFLYITSINSVCPVWFLSTKEIVYDDCEREKMTYKNLRAFIKTKSPPQDYVLKNCKVVIDGRSFFKDAYKKSGFNTILGGEYNRYAIYLKNILKQFIKSNVTCYVIFNGAMDMEQNRRIKIHQKILDEIEALTPGDDNAYCNPILVRDVCKQVLDQLRIKYYVTVNDNIKEMLAVANHFNCALLTNYYEYSLLYVSCISPKSLKFDQESRSFSCKIFESVTVRCKFRVKHPMLHLFFTLANEDTSFHRRLPEITESSSYNRIFGSLLQWTKKQTECLQYAVKDILELLNETEKNEFLKIYEANEDLITNCRCDLAVNHFRNRPAVWNKINNENWLQVEVSNGTIAIPYINLAKNKIFSGSWVVFDKDKEDAMLIAFDIIFYAYRFLCSKIETKKNKSNIFNINFIGRQEYKATVWKVTKQFDNNCNDSQNSELFDKFIAETMPNLNWQPWESVPKDCWILMITLVYFCQRRMDLKLAYSVILSYVMLGPVSDKVGVITKSNLMSLIEVKDDKNNKGLESQDAVSAVNLLIDLFHAKDLENKFDERILHTIAEFQHCLQHMNYLNKLSGKRIKCTIYHKAFNATFVFNAYLKMEDKTMKYFKKCLSKSPVFELYKKLESVFESCLLSVGIQI